MRLPLLISIYSDSGDHPQSGYFRYELPCFHVNLRCLRPRGIIANWQTIDLTTMVFPAVMKVDYVRVYQRKGQTNVGCDPPDYPTATYINNHMEAYTSM